MRSTSRSSEYVIGIDLGGTNMQIGVVDTHNRIIGRDHRKTHARDGAAAVIERISAGVHAACEQASLTLRDIRAVGVAAPGAIDIPRGIVLAAPNLRWTNLPLRDRLHQQLKRPIVLDNDVNAATWGEYHARNLQAIAPDALGVWLGTGVGGGLIIGGKLFHGAFFTAGEIGQTVLMPGGKKGRRIVEDFCSRTGMSRTIKLRLKTFPRSLLREAARRGVVSTDELATAAAQRDQLAVEVVTEAAELLGIAIANWVTVLSLNTVIVGGGVAETLGTPFLKRVRRSFEQHVFPERCRRCKLLMTKLRDTAGMVGAAMLACETL